MNIDNLGMVFGPTLFKNDGKDNNARCAIVDLIHHYKAIFEVWHAVQYLEEGKNILYFIHDL